MQVSREQKLEIVLKHIEEGIPLRKLSEEYGMNPSNIKYNVALYMRHGPDVFKDNSEIRKYSREYKLAAIKRYLEGKESIRLISVDLGLPDHTILRDWLNKYREGGEAAIRYNSLIISSILYIPDQGGLHIL